MAYNKIQILKLIKILATSLTLINLIASCIMYIIKKEFMS